jgi:thiol:disulfide interchange protein
VRESFKGLHSLSGQAITYESLPKHKYLLVEYYATWCAPCVAGRKSLESFFNSASQAKDYVWVSIDMSRLQEAQKARRGAP